jgi:outer membrane protein insertion porin family
MIIQPSEVLQMLKRLFLALIVVLFLIPESGLCLQKPQVIILPFEIHSTEDFSSLREEIPTALGTHLGKAGIKIKEGVDIAQETSVKGEKFYRTLGISSGADYVVWGSLTWIGNSFSIDAKVIDTIASTSAQVLFLSGQSSENLPGVIKELAASLEERILKQERIVEIKIEGNNRIEADAIQRIIESAPGDIYAASKLSQDIKEIYAMGYFDDIRIEAETTQVGKIVTFLVKEKSTIRMIVVKGNNVYKDDELRENMTIRTGSILNVFKIQNNVERIENLYKEKNYHNVVVTYDVKSLEHNQADLEFTVEEGKKVRITRVVFEGNEYVPEKELKKLMKISEKGFFSWLTSSGEFDPEDLEQDAARLTSFYHNEGYIKARVADPVVAFQEDGIEITMKIDEGSRFSVGAIDIEGDLVIPREKLIGKLKIAGEEYYNRETIRNDVLFLNDLYSNYGYAYANISPRINEDADKQEVSITYNVEKGQLVHFEQIIISGNTKTRDKVIRRQLQVYEQGQYSGILLKQGVQNLHRLDYFEDVLVDTSKGSTDDSMILKINVTEKPTGSFSFGGGYSTTENLFTLFSVQQRNLFGRGQTLDLSTQFGGTTNKYNLSFTEPWLFDIPLSATIDLFNWETDYDTYDRDSLGGGFSFGYPVYRYTRAYFGYRYDVSDIRNVTIGAADAIKELEGENTTSSVSTSVVYDSRNRVISPTKGSEHSLSIQFAGLGGNVGFTKYQAETGWYLPLFWKVVGFAHGKWGYVSKTSGKTLPDYQRFFLGGINSLRGFDWENLAPTEINSSGVLAYVGGEKLVQFNAECLIPLVEEAGVVGVLFFDTGDVYADNENIDMGNLRQSIGFGFRWYSPMGPIRVENGYILDPKPGESSGGKWEFTMGTAF